MRRFDSLDWNVPSSRSSNPSTIAYQAPPVRQPTTRECLADGRDDEVVRKTIGDELLSLLPANTDSDTVETEDTDGHACTHARHAQRLVRGLPLSATDAEAAAFTPDSGDSQTLTENRQLRVRAQSGRASVSATANKRAQLPRLLRHTDVPKHDGCHRWYLPTWLLDAQGTVVVTDSARYLSPAPSKHAGCRRLGQRTVQLEAVRGLASSMRLPPERAGDTKPAYVTTTVLRLNRHLTGHRRRRQLMRPTVI